MFEYDGVFYNWVQANIKELLPDLIKLCPNNSSVLIRTIDSDDNLEDWPEFQKVASEIHLGFQDGAVKTRKEDLLRILKKLPDLFNGFDEIWFFEPHKAIVKPEQDQRLVSPFNIAEKFPPSLALWVKDRNCFLGLGDGIGMNFVATKADIAEYIEKIAAS